MIATKTNLEITEYREKFFLGLSLRQLACFAAAAVLATLLPKSGNNYVLATRAAEKAHTKALYNKRG